MLVRLQCVDCKFMDTVKDIFTAEDFEGHLICSQYPDRIPDYVEKGTKDCPRFKTKNAQVIAFPKSK